MVILLSRARRAAHLMLLPGLAILAWQSVMFGLAIVGRKSNPVLAASRAPHNALVQAALAQHQLKQQNGTVTAETARYVLRRDPTNAAAAGVLSMVLGSSDMPRSAALLAYSQRMSRRDLPTQLWAIEHAVQRGDIGTALHHYDIALRVGKAMPSILFPILAGASSDPAIRLPLARMLRSGVPWGSSFLDYLSAHSSDVLSTATLVADLQAGGRPLPRGPVNILIQRLMETGETGRAWALYARANPDAARSALRNGDFRTSPDAPTIFDWRLEDRGDARAEILVSERGGEMHVEANNGVGGAVARQRLLLRPGTYVLAFRARAVEGGTLGASEFNLVCVRSGAQIARVGLADAAAQRRGGTQFSVRADCREQSLEVVLDAGGGETAIDGAIYDVTLAPSARRALQ